MGKKMVELCRTSFIEMEFDLPEGFTDSDDIIDHLTETGQLEENDIDPSFITQAVLSGIDADGRK